MCFLKLKQSTRKTFHNWQGPVNVEVEDLDPTAEAGPDGGGGAECAWKKAHKLLSDHKLIINLKPLTDDKAKFRQWDLKLANVLGQINSAYGEALNKIMVNMDQGKDADSDLHTIFSPTAGRGDEMVEESEALLTRSVGLLPVAIRKRHEVPPDREGRGRHLHEAD